MRQFSDISNMKNALWFPQRGDMFIEKVLPLTLWFPQRGNMFIIRPGLTQ